MSEFCPVRWFISALRSEIFRSYLTIVPVRLQRVLVKKSIRKLALRRAFIVGPIDEHRPADNQIARHKSPVAAVLAVVAIVAHDEIVARGNCNLAASPSVREDRILLFDEVWVVVNVVRSRPACAAGNPRLLRGAFSYCFDGLDLMFRQRLIINDYTSAFHR